jgi:hypothetical protein
MGPEVITDWQAAAKNRGKVASGNGGGYWPIASFLRVESRRLVA